MALLHRSLALALAGRVDFNPATDTLTAPDGTLVRLAAPVGEVLPANGYEAGENTFTAPPADGTGVVVSVFRSQPPQVVSDATRIALNTRFIHLILQKHKM